MSLVNFSMTDIARQISRPTFFLLLSVFLSCTQSLDSRRLETVSMLGAELYSDSGGDSLLTGIGTRLSAEPNNLSILMEKGSALEGLRRYKEAVEIYSQCLVISPESPEILRRRGQRYISLRKLDNAITDLELAARHHTFIKAENLKYTENLNWAIWYYLALTYYLQADFENALTAFQRSYDYSADNVSLLASVNWIHNCLRRLGRSDEARQVVEPIKENMGYSGNYYKCILVYNGTKTELETINYNTVKGFEMCTVGYGMANFHWVNGDKEIALKIFRKIVAEETWQANGFLAAEAELSRIQ